ncbi:hypothetical protein QUB56_27070 [Microcoleus sp. AR_TQ3_B6]|uniref:hypothetical protein n=1 Tax=Microcoleus sp. AR_TQ3_B6 TaxID=3055284 RepID=UPI002FCEC4E0
MLGKLQQQGLIVRDALSAFNSYQRCFCLRLRFVWLQPSSSIASDSHFHIHNAVSY